MTTRDILLTDVVSTSQLHYEVVTSRFVQDAVDLMSSIRCHSDLDTNEYSNYKMNRSNGEKSTSLARENHGHIDMSIRSCSARRRPRASRAPMWLSIKIN